ncbi:transglycosylase [Prosthecomicrobium hirschii]|uniref:murein transglycosylase A n=1 Tax=Prosthecodimorpha hirschii TaxID=665126 RepID=UPI0011271D7D|nr:MltA domain-containing protein [Prosthecomicrobium hirschii]TPQ49194.1 transglycosylase [Prosthecomicrobium hirschii]
MPDTPTGFRLRDLPFAALPGWAEDRHGEAMAAFLLSAARMADDPPRTRTLGVDGAALARIAGAALAAAPFDDRSARAFFETRFRPVAVEPAEGAPFLTGYFEPEVDGSLVPTARFTVPLLRRPDDLVDIRDHNRPPGLDPAFAFARASADGIVPYHDRAAIEDGALAGRGLELVYLEDPVEAYFIHVQGSARIRLAGGGTLRVTYDGKAGWPYTSIGRLLVERGVAPAAEMTADRLIAWLKADPARGRALMRENRSYIFFRETPDLDPALGAVAAAGVQITPGRSLAVDRLLHTFGTPIFLDADLPLGPDGARMPFRRLMVAQDTGSAIVGPARGDVFVGCGAEAGRRAGLIRDVPRAFVLLVPKE